MTQMRPGTGIRDFVARFPPADPCLDHIFRSRWGDHTPCPKCGQFGSWARVKGRNSYRHSCRSHINVLDGTIFHKSNLPLNLWFYALLLVANSSHGIRASFLRKQLGLGLKSSHRMLESLRWQMASFSRPAMLGGPGKKVTIDEAQLRNITSPDHSRQNAIVMGIACDGLLLCGLLQDRKKATLVRNIERFVRPGSTIVTDCWTGYQTLRQLGWDHIAINHRRAFHDFYGNTTNEVETYWTILKRTLRAYRQISIDNLPALLGEVEFRFNRRQSRVSMFDEMIAKFDNFPDGNLCAPVQRYLWDQ